MALAHEISTHVLSEYLTQRKWSITNRLRAIGEAPAKHLFDEGRCALVDAEAHPVHGD
jgi:hypothetical protein